MVTWAKSNVNVNRFLALGHQWLPSDHWVSQVPSLPVSQVPSLLVSQVPSLLVSQVPSLPVSQVPSLPVSQVPSLPVSQVPSVPVCGALRHGTCHDLLQYRVFPKSLDRVCEFRETKLNSLCFDPDITFSQQPVLFSTDTDKGQTT